MKSLKKSRKLKVFFMLAAVIVTVLLAVYGRKPYDQSFSDYYYQKSQK